MRAKRKGFGGGEEGEVKADLERGKKTRHRRRMSMQ